MSVKQGAAVLRPTHRNKHENDMKTIEEANFANASKIVIDKACEWLIENLDYYVGEGGWNYLVMHDDCESCSESIAKDFRKAMEE